MERRDFLKTLGAFAAIAAFPKLLTPPIEVLPLVYIHKRYALGYTISQEMIDDDIYGIWFDLGGMAKVMAEEIDREMTEKYSIPKKRRSRKLFREEYRPVRLLSS